MRALLALLLLSTPAGLSKTERNLLGYLPTESLEATSAEAPALRLGCDGEPTRLSLDAQSLHLASDGEELVFALDKVEATNAGWGLRLSRTGADKGEPHSFAVEFVRLDPKRGLWQLTSDPDGLGAGRYRAVFVDARKADKLPRKARPARECQ